ncbi:MAG: hypothetical protein IT370_00030 [Deltaproteobacteria bacterium]|nr:hypothetical protein [Deltaproteobacteria bacterium]
MAVAVVVALVGSAGVTRAQDTDVELQRDEAAGLMQQQRFAEAGALYHGLFERTKQSGFLYQSAVAYEQADDRSRALALYQQYLAVEPGGEHSQQAYEAVERLSPDVGVPQGTTRAVAGGGDGDAPREEPREHRPISIDLAALLAVPVGNLGDESSAPGIRLAAGYLLGKHFRPAVALHYVRLASGVSLTSLRLGGRLRAHLSRTIDLFGDLELGYDTFSEDYGDDVHSEMGIALRGGGSYEVSPIFAVMAALSYGQAPITDAYLEFAYVEVGGLLSF